MAVTKPVTWMASSLKDIQAMPEEAQDEIGYALGRVQEGKHHRSIKPLTGFSGVFQITANIDSDTYRLVYVVNLPDAIYVLHAFKKKSKSGIATPKKEMDLIRSRLRRAQEAANDQHR